MQVCNDKPPSAVRLRRGATSLQARSAPRQSSTPGGRAFANPSNTLAVDAGKTGDSTVSTVTTKDGVQIFYKDWGHGQPIVFHHGWPLSSDDWETQMLFFLHHGYRVIGIDPRGHGRSRQGSHRHVIGL